MKKVYKGRSVKAHAGFALLLFAFPFVLHAQCGSDLARWNAKTLNDGSQLTTVAIHTTIAEQDSLPRPPKWQAQPRYPNERVLLTLEGDIVMAGEEANDNDFHLVFTDGNNSMIIEIPSPDDCQEITTHQTEYELARKKAESLFGTITGTAVHPVTPKHVKVTGYGFYDKIAHGDGHAPNGREIHPVLSIQ